MRDRIHQSKPRPVLRLLGTDLIPVYLVIHPLPRNRATSETLTQPASVFIVYLPPHTAKVAPLVEKINKTHGYRISIIGNTFRFVLRRNGQDKTVTSTTTLPLHTWTHVAARYDGVQMRIFINGTIESATTATTGSLSATTTPLFIGGEHNHFHGYLDDISIYDRALSDSEITDLVNCVDKRYEYHHVNAS